MCAVSCVQVTLHSALVWSVCLSNRNAAERRYLSHTSRLEVWILSLVVIETLKFTQEGQMIRIRVKVRARNRVRFRVVNRVRV